MSKKTKQSNHIATLQLFENKKLKRSLRIYRNKVYTCGRDIECTIPIQGDQYISSIHFRFWCMQFDSTCDPIVYVQDTSLNGTLSVDDKEQNIVKIKNRDVAVVKNGTCLYFPHEVHGWDKMGDSVMRFKFLIEKKKICNKECDEELEKMLDGLKSDRKLAKRWIFDDTFFGSGSFGMVCGCIDLSNKKKLTVCKIIKDTIIPTKFESEAEFVSAYKRKYGKSPLLHSKAAREMQIIRKLNHPNVVKYIDHYSTDEIYGDELANGNIFNKRHFLIFQEQAFGGDLFSYLLDPKTLTLRSIPEAECLLIIYQIMLALEYLHSKNLAHRDLKLDNILLETPEKLGRIMLTDFGIAKQKNTLRMKTCIGTPEYSAPEVGNFHKSTMRDVIQSKLSKKANEEIKAPGYDKKCDIWSLGIIFYYLLTGEPFFEKKYDESIMERFEKYTLEDLQSWIDGRLLRLQERFSVSEECVNFLNKMLKIDEEERYDIAECFEDDYIKGHRSSLENIYKGILASSKYESAVMTKGNNAKKRKL